jgi:ABC-type polysaccharide/polyol phosphate transport system ATPase subunit
VSATVRDPAGTVRDWARGGGARGEGAPAISIAHLTKTFKLPHEQYHTLKERALHPFRPQRYDLVRAVDDVSVEIAQGEFFGIVGRNGSGKSTLLKCLAGIYGVDSGEIAIRGRLSPFIELGVGFNPDLAARDNVIINAIMLGLTRVEARARFDAIVEFAELQQFMDLKLKNYSSGMHVRLAFAVAIQVDAPILLIDEVLAVGDASFQQKCFDEFNRLKAAGRTIVFVTHDMGSVERFCDRAMLLDSGRVVDIGEPASIARQYNEINFASLRAASAAAQGLPPAKSPSDRQPDSERPPAEILGARFESPAGEKIVSAPAGEPCCVTIDVRFHAAVDDPLFAIELRTERGEVAFATSSQSGLGPSGHFRAGQQVTVTLRFENWLAPGRYDLSTAVKRNGPGADSFDTRARIASIIVHANKAGGGAVDLPHTFRIERR